jgi:hypothetical protein
MVIIHPVKLGILYREEHRLRIVAVFTLEPTTCPILSQWIQTTFLSSFCRIYFNVTHLSTPGSSNCSVSIRLLHWNDVCLSLLAFTCCMPCPSHSSSFDTQIMILRITNHEALHYVLFSSPLLLPSSLAEYLLEHPVLEHSQHTFSLNVRDQV